MRVSFASVVFVFSLAVSTQASALDCRPDTLLNRAAEKVVRNNAEVPTADGLLSLVRRLGSDVAPVFAKVGSIKDKAGFQSWMARIGTKADGPLVCGRAKRGDVRAVVLGVRAGWLNISKDGVASVRLAKGFTTPYLVARLGDGTENVTPVRSLAEGRFKKTKVSSDAVVVQLVATGSRGPRPIAEVWLGNDADRPPTIKASRRRDTNTMVAPSSNGCGFIRVTAKRDSRIRGGRPCKADVQIRSDRSHAQTRGRPSTTPEEERTDRAACRRGIGARKNEHEGFAIT